ncbi:MAG: hypothetical protein HFH76_10780 [Lachnospiraceae bacterium]|jgi:tRNA(adenine34) deaminase|nr:hypothetical protein [Lachnospiraceae bacterium]
MTVNEKMKLVIDLAERALEKNELPIACIIFHNDTIVAQSHTSESEDDRLLVHAELKALMELDQKKMKANEKRQMELFTNLEPCMMCLGDRAKWDVQMAGMIFQTRSRTMNVVHKGWNWENIDSESWLDVSEEFLPVALKWREQFHSILDIGAGKGRHSIFLQRMVLM